MDYKLNRLDERLLTYCQKNGVDITALDNPKKVLAVIEGDKLIIKEWNVAIKRPTVTDLKKITLIDVKSARETMLKKQRGKNPMWKVIQALCDANNVDIESVLRE